LGQVQPIGPQQPISRPSYRLPPSRSLPLGPTLSWTHLALSSRAADMRGLLVKPPLRMRRMLIGVARYPSPPRLGRCGQPNPPPPARASCRQTPPPPISLHRCIAIKGLVIVVVQFFASGSLPSPKVCTRASTSPSIFCLCCGGRSHCPLTGIWATAVNTFPVR
jgi:hypothetical protein